MESYKELYFYLFNALTDALEELDHGRVILAMDQLKAAQQQAEEACLQFDILPDQ